MNGAFITQTHQQADTLY